MDFQSNEYHKLQGKQILRERVKTGYFRRGLIALVLTYSAPLPLLITEMLLNIEMANTVQGMAI